ncbi:MAG: DNA-binding protein [Ruminococcus sp.]|jgi:predicted DNA-binding protein YlxM (UPF0122 family)|nr:DNA-binding protein [Ruminococcus sp.]
MNTEIKDLGFCKLLDYYSAVLTDKQRDSVNAYYNDDLSLGEIAAIENISRQGVRDNIKRAEVLMTELEAKLGLMEKAETYFALTETLKEKLEKITAEIKGRGSFAAIQTAVDDCNTLIDTTIIF